MRAQHCESTALRDRECHNWTNKLCTPRKYSHTPYFPHRRNWDFLGDRGFCKTQNFKEMCEALLEFPEGLGGGGGVLGKKPTGGGGMDIFWNYTPLRLLDFSV